jgi:hypothetical protein
LSWPWSRKIGVAVLLTIPAWWRGLHAWANSQFGYLEVDHIGASPYLWLASMAVVGVLLVIKAVPSDRHQSGNRVTLVIFLVVAGALAFGELIAAMPNGISLPGLALGAFSLFQVALVMVAFAAHQRQRPGTAISVGGPAA